MPFTFTEFVVWGLVMYALGYWLGLQWTDRRRRRMALEVDEWLSRLRGRS